jgi:hypothetical protein
MKMRVDESSIKLLFAFCLASTLIDSLGQMASFSYSGYFLMSCFVHNRFGKDRFVIALKIKKERIKNIYTQNMSQIDTVINFKSTTMLKQANMETRPLGPLGQKCNTR